jgi:hypothetical protein
MAAGSDAVSFFIQKVSPIWDSNCRYHPLIIININNVMKLETANGNEYIKY